MERIPEMKTKEDDKFDTSRHVEAQEATPQSTIFKITDKNVWTRLIMSDQLNDQNEVQNCGDFLIYDSKKCTEEKLHMALSFNLRKLKGHCRTKPDGKVDIYAIPGKNEPVLKIVVQRCPEGKKFRMWNQKMEQERREENEIIPARRETRRRNQPFSHQSRWFHFLQRNSFDSEEEKQQLMKLWFGIIMRFYKQEWRHNPGYRRGTLHPEVAWTLIKPSRTRANGVVPVEANGAEQPDARVLEDGAIGEVAGVVDVGAFAVAEQPNGVVRLAEAAEAVEDIGAIGAAEQIEAGEQMEGVEQVVHPIVVVAFGAIGAVGVPGVVNVIQPVPAVHAVQDAQPILPAEAVGDFEPEGAHGEAVGANGNVQAAEPAQAYQDEFHGLVENIVRYHKQIGYQGNPNPLN